MGELVSLTAWAARRWWLGFDALYKSGMTLIEDTASYLDGPGRIQSKALSDPLQSSYRNVSMRATTLLMQIASWLLIVRSHYKDKEMPEQEFREQWARLKTRNLKALTDEDLVEMPDEFCSLAKRTNALLAEILKADSEYLPKLDSEVPQSSSG